MEFLEILFQILIVVAPLTAYATYGLLPRVFKVALVGMVFANSLLVLIMIDQMVQQDANILYYPAKSPADFVRK